MLIKYYSTHKSQSLNNESLHKEECQLCIKRKYKNLEYTTTSLSIFDNIKMIDILVLFKNQEDAVKKELELFEKYNYITQTSKTKTEEQYNTFFFYEGHAYLKEEIKLYLFREEKGQNTYLKKAPKTIITIEQLKENNQRGVSRVAIRNITGYTFNPIPSHGTEPVYVEWQQQLLEDANDIVVVNGSRQIGKSFTIAEKCIEESHLPNNDMLVGGFTTNTTNIIRNYVLRYVRKFPKDTFTHYKSERYIINNLTGTKIYFRTLADDAQSILGMTLKLIIVDEAQLVDEFVYEEVLMPTLSTTGGRLIMILTPGRKRSGYAFKKIMEIRKGLLPDSSLYDVDITQNPFIHPKKRAEIMARKDEPGIRRQYFCDWNDGGESLFNLPNAEVFPELLKDGFFVLGKDPARLKDRSGYALIYIFNGHATIIQSGFVPDNYKKDWSLQAKFYKELIKKYKDKDYINWYNGLDVSGVGDGVAQIFTKDGIPLHMKLRYTAGTAESNDKNDYKCGKSTLINTTLDLIQEGLLDIVPQTNKDLLEELSYMEEDETRTGLTAMSSQFFDDITNAMMIANYLIVKYNLLKRIPKEELKNVSSGSKLVDYIEKGKTYQTQTQDNDSDTW